MKQILLDVMPTTEPCLVYLRNSKGDFLKIKSSEMEAFIYSCPDQVEPDRDRITDVNKIFELELERRIANNPKLQGWRNAGMELVISELLKPEGGTKC